MTLTSIWKLVGLIVAVALCFLQPQPTLEPSVPKFVSLVPGCTTFYGYDGQVALAGNNEDFINPMMYAWIIPASSGRLGRVYFGFDDFIPQGGLNEAGVFFDGQSLPYQAGSSDKPQFPGGGLSLIDEVLSRSANTQDVIDILSKWDRLGSEYGQLLFGDRYGASAIFDGDTILSQSGSFQIATNFRLADHPAPPWPEGEERYGLVTELLAEPIPYSVELFRQALELSHSDGPTPTLYSQVYELNTGIIHLYLYHDFEHEVIIDLAEELAKGPHVIELSSLFPENSSMDLWATQQIFDWRAGYQGLIDTSASPASLDWIRGQFDVVQESGTGPVSISIEGDQIFMQRPNQLAIELYPKGAQTVFHRFLNGFDLTFTFQRNLWGEVTDAQGTFNYEPYSISIPYDLSNPGVISFVESLALALGALAAMIIFILSFRRNKLRITK
jgi:hypothetical protein